MKVSDHLSCEPYKCPEMQQSGYPIDKNKRKMIAADLAAAFQFIQQNFPNGLKQTNG